MKEKFRLIGIGVVILLVLVSGVLYLNYSGNNSQGGIWVNAEGISKIQCLDISNSTLDRIMKLEQKEDKWYLDNEQEYDNDDLLSALSALGYLKAERVVEVDSEYMIELGLQDSEYSITMEYEDGTCLEYAIGNYIEGTGLYILECQNEIVYLIDETRAESIQEFVQGVFQVELTQINFNNINGINIVTTDEEILINKSESPRAEDDFYWTLHKAVTWNASTDVVSNMLEITQQIKYVQYLDSANTEDDYGFVDENNIITIYDTSDQELVIQLGDVVGDYVYCIVTGFDDVYLMDVCILDLLKVDVEELVDATLYYYEVPTVTSCVIESEYGNHSLSGIWETSESSDTTGQRFYLDGVQVTGEEYRTIVSWFNDTMVELAEEVVLAEQEEIASVQIERLSFPYEETIIFYEHDTNANEVYAEVDDQTVVTIKKEDLYSFLNQFD